jgi:O-6-methylguanine DNA methyltransferase
MGNSKWKMKRGFRECIVAVVRDIPRGKVLSYAEVARRAGFPGAARPVGSLMAKNFDPKIPCHRVIRSDGRTGEYNRGGETAKGKLLEREGVLFDAHRRVVSDNDR